jgi:hypothetical protein
MVRLEAKEKYYRKFDPDMWEEYKDADRYVYINVDDPDLQKFRIGLPEPPDWMLIDGFGLPAEKQYFQYERYPDRLKMLERTVRNDAMLARKGESKFGFERKIYDEIWHLIENNVGDWQFEIDWIRRQWYFREYGKWQFIHGKPVYIDGWNWFYLNYYTLEQVGRPDYWDRDRKWFHAQRYAYTTTLAPEYNSDGSLILLPDGTPKMIDMGARTVYGTNCLKGRRVGDTSKAECISLCEVMSNFEYYCGIQGNKETTASGIYKEKVTLAFKRIPFFFRPMMSNFNIATELNFSSPDFFGGLNSKLDFATTAKRHFYDSKKLNIIHIDEPGKTEGESVDRRNEVLKRCIAPGATIKGLMINTSTVDDMEMNSAKEFFKLTKASHFHDRGPAGQTKSGLLIIYFDVTESYEGFIDQYGMPIIYTPKTYQIPYMKRIVRNDKGEIMGCREYLDSVEEDIRQSGDIMRLMEFKRMTPRSFRDCFANAGRNQFFNTEILKSRLSYLHFTIEDKIRVGDLVWTAGFGSKVEFIDNPKTGRFRVSMLPAKEHRSLIVSDGAVKRPLYHEVFVCSGDAFRVEKTEGYRMSLGSGAVLYMHDPTIDGEDRPIREWSTNKFVCTYVYRPPTREEYAEDMLKMAILWGALMYPENNIDVIGDYFIRKGFGGYLAYSVDPVTGKRKQNAGWTTAGPTIKTKMFSVSSDWINLHGMRCDHPEILEEFLEIDGPDSMKDHDLFVSLAGCLLAQESKYVDYVHTMNNTSVDVSGWW